MSVDTQMSPNVPTSYENKSIIRKLCREVWIYFRDDKHREEFKEWYFEKYGVPYEFKRMEVKRIADEP